MGVQMQPATPIFGPITLQLRRITTYRMKRIVKQPALAVLEVLHLFAPGPLPGRHLQRPG
jgi:hypothetical protein